MCSKPTHLIQSSNFERRDVNEYGLAFEEIREEKMYQEGRARERQRKEKAAAFCDVCLVLHLIAISKKMAFYLCNVCEKYLCYKCFKGHESHKYIKLVGKKRDEQIESFLDEMRNESEREEKFDRENVSMVDRVNVKHGLNQNKRWVTGLCGLDDKSFEMQSQTVKFQLSGKNVLALDELEFYELAQLAGVSMEPATFKIILDLLRLNVSPQAVLQMLKTMCSGKLKKRMEGDNRENLPPSRQRIPSKTRHPSGSSSSASSRRTDNKR